MNAGALAKWVRYPLRLRWVPCCAYCGAPVRLPYGVPITCDRHAELVYADPHYSPPSPPLFS